MTYKVPYITADIYPVKFLTASHILTINFTVNTQKMLVSPSDFRVKLERLSNSSQSTRPVDFTRNYEQTNGIFVP